MSEKPLLLICMGVSGCGKSTVAKELSNRFKLRFLEADEFHPEQNHERMAAGIPLTDEMRLPWIEAMCIALTEEARRGRNCVLAYSGLRQKQRQAFRELGFRTLYLFLEGSKSLIAGRMAERRDHFMPAGLLDSQFDDMEPPFDEPDVVCIDIDKDLAEVLSEISPVVDDFFR